MAILFI